MNERDLLHHIYQRSADLAARFGAVLVGPGDDCAVVATPRGDALLLTVDQVVEGRHFTLHESLAPHGAPHGATLAQLARKAIARSISDIAAMGGRPAWALATGLLPRAWPHADALFNAMADVARDFDCPLVGGDIAMWGEPDAQARAHSAPSPPGAVALTVTIGGTPHEARGPVLRSGARPGDLLYVTGALGGSLGSGRHLSFTPRLQEATWLCDSLGAHLHAMIDISDGLGLDASRVGVASQALLEVDAAAMPRHADASDWRAAAAEGEDYELLFAADPSAEVAPACPLTGTPVTRIGRLSQGEPGCTIVAENGAPIDGANLGWNHGT